MISKLNQTNINFSCTQATSNINLFSGRLLLDIPMLTIGVGSYEIGVKMFYDSQANDNYPAIEEYDTGLPHGWRLNVHQYLKYVNEDTYIYYDQNGYQHTFVNYKENCYYDTSGLGLTLEIITGVKRIKDELNNVIEFRSDNRVEKIISGVNSKMVKRYYYTGNKISKIYDDRKPSRYISFEYDNNRLSKIKTSDNSYILKINYESGQLTEILEGTNKTFKNKLKINYAFGGLNYVLCGDKTYLKFLYNSQKVSKVITGVAKVTSNYIEGNELYYLGEEHYFSDDIYLGEKEVKKVKDTVDFINTGIKTQTSINYIGTYKTLVTNDKNIKMAYYFNEKGFTTAILEANNEDINDLRTLEKMPGILIMDKGSDSESINTHNAHTINTNQTLHTYKNEFMNNKLESLRDYRFNKYKNFSNYTISFWLKLVEKLENPKIRLRITSPDTDMPLFFENTITFDKSAVGSWQYVSIPVKFPDDKTREKLYTIKINFEEQDMNKTVKIADMRFSYSPVSKVMVTNGTDSISLDKIKSIKYKPNEFTTETIENIDDNFYLSEADLYSTYLSLFKATKVKIPGVDIYPFELFYCDKTKKKVVNNVILCDEDGAEFKLEFGTFPTEYETDKYEESYSQARFFIEMRSPNDDLYTYNYTYFLKDKTFNDIPIDCVRRITEANLYKKKVDNKPIRDHKESYIEVYTDLTGKVLKQQDEYKVQTLYKYDTYGNLSSKTIQHDETSEKITYIKTTTDNNVNETNVISNKNTYYNDTSGNVEKIEYSGKDEIDNTLTTNFGYSIFNDKVISIKNNNDIIGENYMRYDSNGRLLEVTPIGWNDNNMYGFKFGYDGLGNSNKFNLTYKEGNLKCEDPLVEKNINYTNGTITTKHYRSKTDSNDQDNTIVKLDKYGRTSSIVEGTNITTFNRQNLSESAGATEVTEMYDPFEDRTYFYSYDDFNRVKGYEIKEGKNNKDGKTFLSIKASGENEVQYSNLSNKFTSIINHSSKLINPRIEEAKVGNYSSYYEYDALGRVSERTLRGLNYNFMTEHFSYKKGTLIPEEIRYTLDQYGKYTPYIFNYDIDKRGNLRKSNLKEDYGDFKCNYTNEYTYDKANRLKSEIRTDKIEGIDEKVYNYSYVYNKDGNIKTERGSRTRNYEYQKGRLTSFYDPNFTGNLTYFNHDNLGNCITYMSKDKNLKNMSWVRGNLLEHYTTANSYYYYNSQGTRFKKMVNNKTIIYYLDGNKLLGENLNNERFIEYNYDANGISGFQLTGLVTKKYFYVKDAYDNVVLILDENGKEVAEYRYDAWGNCDITVNIDDMANINPIRWKSQYYDQESELYYINGRYYSPEIKQYISASSPESAMANAGVIYGLNMYSLTIDNPVNMVYNGHTIETNVKLTWEPDDPTGWQKFWNTPLGESLGLIGLLVTFTLGGVWSGPLVLAGLIISGTVAGYRSKNLGKGFMHGFNNYINDVWSQTWAISGLIEIVIFAIGVVTTSRAAVSNAGSKAPLANVTEGVKHLDPGDIHFMQSSIKNSSKGGYTVLDNATALRNGTLKATDLPTIRVWQDGAGKIWTLDHRRLASYRLAGLNEVPVQWVGMDVVQNEMWKMTTRTGGTSIRLKIDIGIDMLVR